MQNDFRSFSKKDNEKILNENQDKANEYKNIYDKYKNMNSNELMTALFNEANKLKSQGKLDNNTLNSLSSSLAPYLNDEQKQVLNNLIKMMKD